VDIMNSTTVIAHAAAAAAPAAPTGWLGVDWGAIVVVFVVGIVATVVITGSYAFGTRLLAVGAPPVLVPPGSEADGPDVIELPRTTPRPAIATLGAWLCYAVGIVAAGYGIYLVIPLFHQ
jgi:hypothetical protein